MVRSVIFAPSAVAQLEENEGTLSHPKSSSRSPSLRDSMRTTTAILNGVSEFPHLPPWMSAAKPRVRKNNPLFISKLKRGFGSSSHPRTNVRFKSVSGLDYCASRSVGLLQAVSGRRMFDYHGRWSSSNVRAVFCAVVWRPIGTTVWPSTRVPGGAAPIRRRFLS